MDKMQEVLAEEYRKQQEQIQKVKVENMSIAEIEEEIGKANQNIQEEDARHLNEKVLLNKRLEYWYRVRCNYKGDGEDS